MRAATLQHAARGRRGSRRCPAGSVAGTPRTCTSPVSSGCAASMRSYARNPRTMFLLQIRAVHAEDEVLRPPLLDALDLREHGGLFRMLDERLRIDADRVVAHPHRAALGEHGALAMVDGESEVLLARHQEVAHVAQRLKADDVGAEQAVHDRIADVPRQHRPVLRRRPRDVHEVLDAHVGPALANQPGDAVQLVVLHEDEQPACRSARPPRSRDPRRAGSPSRSPRPTRVWMVSSTTGSRARSHR